MVWPDWRRAAAAITHIAGDSTGAPGPPPSSAVDTALSTAEIALTGAATKEAIGCWTVHAEGVGGATAATLDVLARAVVPTGADLVTGVTAAPWTSDAPLALAAFDEDTDTCSVVGTEVEPTVGFFLGLCLFDLAESLPVVSGVVEDCAEITTPAASFVVEVVPELDPPADVTPGSAPPVVEPVDGDGELAPFDCSAATVGVL